MAIESTRDLCLSVADAIREKKGSSDLINPQDFAKEIASIESGGNGGGDTPNGYYWKIKFTNGYVDPLSWSEDRVNMQHLLLQILSQGFVHTGFTCYSGAGSGANSEHYKDNDKILYFGLGCTAAMFDASQDAFDSWTFNDGFIFMWEETSLNFGGMSMSMTDFLKFVVLPEFVEEEVTDEIVSEFISNSLELEPVTKEYYDSCRTA